MTTKRMTLLAKILEEEKIYKKAQEATIEGDVDPAAADQMAEQIFDQLFDETIKESLKG
jgi:hypothetical protein